MTETVKANAATAAASSGVNGADIGLLVARVGFGGLLAVHGSQKLFGWFNGYGLDATAQGFQGMGYHPGKSFATLAGLSEITGGLLLVLGLLTPLAAAIALGTMINAVNVGWSGGFAMWELPAVYALAAVAFAFAGPGRLALDRGRPWQRQGLIWGAGAVVLGVVAALITLALK
ncbi:DoxX family protein [Nocardia aurantiaca]|uniref:DoxX family membrane protein n=1 Tax=Nocardia aurantiaca TaxID=2675850 RepID=A0A6I3L5G9_9NOCA|nr:DoxX family protein [Nocardia aurantiaca]MTE15894.1 DoxX family membrane protein [Nocardia aurantiaca]